MVDYGNCGLHVYISILFQLKIQEVQLQLKSALI